MKVYLSVFFTPLIFFIAGGCSITKPPKKPFEAYTPSAIPDYSQAHTWAALPEKVDSADKTPPGVSPENQLAAQTDVFFIHPTTFMGGVAWNANVNDKELNAKTDARAIKHQASLFNHSCRVYAPRYRQMSFGGFFSDDKPSEYKAINLAYEDVKQAFNYYMEHYNQGRPIVIATHSQGTIHGIRLIKEYFDGKPLQEKLVAAYFAGWPFPADTLAFIPICDSATQTGCVMGWNTWKKGAVPKKDYTHFYDRAVVTNPLSWRSDTIYAPETLHKGFLYPNYKKIRSGKQDAQAHNGLLWTKKPFPIIPTQNYHAGDYNLFWVDIRENVAARVKAYFNSHPAH
ncbi:MAG: DUF3089 domain-containing protein [Bacteroidia bacterium]|nr:DUF3089 domain-containing protein [Bacteroidia bacterium]